MGRKGPGTQIDRLKCRRQEKAVRETRGGVSKRRARRHKRTFESPLERSLRRLREQEEREPRVWGGTKALTPQEGGVVAGFQRDALWDERGSERHARCECAFCTTSECGDRCTQAKEVAARAVATLVRETAQAVLGALAAAAVAEAIKRWQ